MRLKVILISLGVIVLGIIIGVILYLNSEYKLNLDRKSNLIKVSNDFYENYYYPSVGEDYVKKYKDNSLKISLSTLKNNNRTNSKIKSKLFKKCDEDNTYVEITPVSPYKSGDYKAKAYLSC